MLGGPWGGDRPKHVCLVCGVKAYKYFLVSSVSMYCITLRAGHIGEAILPPNFAKRRLLQSATRWVL